MGSKLLIKPLDFIHQNTQNLTSTFDSFDSYSDSTLFMIDVEYFEIFQRKLSF